MNSLNISTSASSADIVSSLEAMRMQEESTYHCEDYLYHQQVDQPNAPLNARSTLDADCRAKMVQWCYQIVDFCSLSRETTAIAISYLDRFVATPTGSRALYSRKYYQLAAMTCLYTAVKIYEPEAIDPALVSNLSRGMYTESQITDMEVEILNALGWRVNPPSTMSFIRHFLSLIPSSAMSPESLEAALEIARFQSETAVCDYEFVKIRDSTIAFACVANALECVGMNKYSLNSYLESVAKVASIDTDSMQLSSAQNALYNSGALKKCQQLVPAAITSAKTVETGCGSVHGSPRSVANRA